MMKRSCIIALAVLCLLQRRASGEPRPDFALEAKVYGTVRVSGAISEAQPVVADIDAKLYITLSSGNAALSNLLLLSQEVGETVVELLEKVLNPLGILAPASESQDVELFDTVLNAVDSLKQFVHTRLLDINAELELAFGASLTAQFSDSLGRMSLGLQELASALGALKEVVAVLLPLETSVENSEELGYTNAVRPSLVYRVVSAVRTLKAYLPVVTYTLSTVVENVATADHFLVSLRRIVADVQEPGQYTDPILATTSQVSGAVNDATASVQAMFYEVNDTVSALSDIPSLTAYVPVREALASIRNTLQQLSTAGPAFQSALADIAEKLRLALETEPSKLTSQVVATLVTTLVSDGPYARYCFHKYRDLLFALVGEGRLGLEECISKELSRLEHLRDALSEQVVLMRYDLEDIAGQMLVCNTLPETGARAACLERIAPFYTEMATSFEAKFNALYEHGSLEADASENRLLLCAKVLHFHIVAGLAEDLTDKIKQCARVLY
uniref:Protein TsetseEP domain-containing protein n=1 Tax=Anopheles dirus TaxID=7168 RepID=A0A182NKP7_9DIPT